jgi:hypothetical protein
LYLIYTGNVPPFVAGFSTGDSTFEKREGDREIYKWVWPLNADWLIRSELTEKKAD